MLRARGWALLLPWAFIAACQDSGAVHLRIQLPQVAALSPASSHIARMTLVVESEGEPAQSVTRDLPTSLSGAPAVSFGDIGVAHGVQLSVLGFTASGRLVGFGRASTPVDVAAGEVRDVAILLRRPYAYVAGGSKLHVFDTTVEPGQPFADTLDAAPHPTAVATTPDGAQVVVVGDDTLSLISTSNHQPTPAPPVAVTAGATAAAVSPDGRWAVLLHTAGDGPKGATVVDLDALRAGSTQPTFIEIADAGGLAVASGTAYVLAAPLVPGPPPDYQEDCQTPSMLVPIVLGPAPQAGTPIPLAGAVRGVAVIPDGSAVLIAEPCQDGIVRVTAGGATQVRILMLPSATSVAVAGGRLWAVGHSNGTSDVHLVLATADIDGGGATLLNLPVTQELAQSNDLAEAGQIVEVRLDADRLDAYALSVLPDGRSVALLVHGSYHADAVSSIVPSMDLENYEYQLVDLTTGVTSQRVRTSCDIEWEHGTAVLDDWSCSAPDGSGALEDFIPGQAAVLYGAP